MYSISLTTSKDAAVWKLNIDDFPKWERIQNFLSTHANERVYVTARDCETRKGVYYINVKVVDDFDAFQCMQKLRGDLVDNVAALREVYGGL